MKLILSALLALGSVQGNPVFAQELGKGDMAPNTSADSLMRRNTIGLLLDQNLNTFFWQGRAMVDTSFAGFRTFLREQYQTTVVQLESDPTKRVQSNQQQVSTALTMPAIGSLAASLRWDSFIYTDSRDVGLSRASSNTGLAGFIVNPYEGITISPYAGYRWDNQSGLRDRGATYMLEANMHPMVFDGYLVGGSGQYREDRLSPRLLENNLVKASVQKAFSEYTSDSLDAGVLGTRRELYSPDSSIESRQEMIIQFSNFLRYSLTPSLRANIYVGLNSRGLDKVLRYPTGLRPLTAFDSHVDEFHLDTYIEGQWRPDDNRGEATIRLGYNERNELHTILPAEGQTTGPLYAERKLQEESKNNLARTTSVFGHATYHLSNADVVFLNGLTSILRYDTPSNQNDDDRDELLVALSLGSTHRISRVLDVGVALDGTLGHLVYLHSDMSANNNINRVLRLAPRTSYRPYWWLSSSNAFEVMASYTVYDFEYAGETVKSYSYRQFSWIDSTTVSLTSRVSVDGYIYLKLYERGQLNWGAFTEQPENSFADKTYVGQLRFRPSPGLDIAVGLKFFSQTRFVYALAGETVDSYYRSIGPLCMIRWLPGPHSEIGLRGWYEVRHQSDGTTKGLTTLTFSILMNL